MIPDKAGKEPAAHLEDKTGGACLQVPDESCRKASSVLSRHSGVGTKFILGRGGGGAVLARQSLSKNTGTAEHLPLINRYTQYRVPRSTLELYLKIFL